MNKYYQVALEDLQKQKISDRYAQLKEAKIYNEPLLAKTLMSKNDPPMITDRSDDRQT